MYMYRGAKNELKRYCKIMIICNIHYPLHYTVFEAFRWPLDYSIYCRFGERILSLVITSLIYNQLEYIIVIDYCYSSICGKNINTFLESIKLIKTNKVFQIYTDKRMKDGFKLKKDNPINMIKHHPLQWGFGLHDSCNS
jgi:hypothetical protein